MNHFKQQLIKIYVLGFVSSTSFLSQKYYITHCKDVSVIYPWSSGIGAYCRAFTHSLLWPYHIPSAFYSIKNAYKQEQSYVQQVKKDLKK
jgi:hypothetical protein